MKPARLPIGNASAWSEGGIGHINRIEGLALGSRRMRSRPKIKKGFEAHSIYSIDMSPVGTQWGCTDVGCLARAL